MKKFRVLFLSTLFVFFSCMAVWSIGFGLELNQGAGLSGSGNNSDFYYSGILIPRLTGYIGDTGDFTVTAGISAEYYNGWTFVPELLRTELNFNVSSIQLTAGRMNYSDPLGFITEGLFDGVRVSFGTDLGTFSLGAWYTGLLYKKRANIAMTNEEFLSINTDLDYNDFTNTYFASSRFIYALDWEHSIGSAGLNLSLLGQFDLNNAPAGNVNTQYFAGTVNMPLGNTVRLDVGAALGLSQAPGEDLGIGILGTLDAKVALPTSFDSNLSIQGLFSSGKVEGSPITAFKPVTTRPLGNVLGVQFSGISMISLDYEVNLGIPSKQLASGLIAGLTASYFIRSDLSVFASQFGNTGFFLGSEISARVSWILSDLQLNLSGGVFLPSMGDAAPNADLRWRTDLNLVLKLF